MPFGFVIYNLFKFYCSTTAVNFVSLNVFANAGGKKEYSDVVSKFG